MKTYFVISDVHSFYDQMIQALTEKGFDINNNEHIIISCGDNFDRGDQSMEVLNFLYDLTQKNRTILIKGNHEDLFQDMVIRGYARSHDLSNRTYKTLEALSPKDCHTFIECKNNYDKRIDELISKMVDYYETPHYVFVHGWLPCLFTYNDNWRDPEEYDKSVWKDYARWENGIEQAVEFKNIIPDKTVVCGHWHCFAGNLIKYKDEVYGLDESDIFDSVDAIMKEWPEIFEPFYAEGIIAIDACTALTKKCNCLKFTEEEL